MSTLLSSLATINLKASNIKSILQNKKINKINKALLDLEKEEITSLNPLKVKIFKDEKEDQKNKNKIIIPSTFKSYFEDFKKRGNFINQIESGLVTPSSAADSGQVEQANSSDLVDSD